MANNLYSKREGEGRLGSAWYLYGKRGGGCLKEYGAPGNLIQATLTVFVYPNA